MWNKYILLQPFLFYNCYSFREPIYKYTFTNVSFSYRNVQGQFCNCMVKFWKQGEVAEAPYQHYLREAHWRFCNLGDENDISICQFCKITPTNVLLMQDTPKDQCK